MIGADVLRGGGDGNKAMVLATVDLICKSSSEWQWQHGEHDAEVCVAVATCKAAINNSFREVNRIFLAFFDRTSCTL